MCILFNDEYFGAGIPGRLPYFRTIPLLAVSLAHWTVETHRSVRRRLGCPLPRRPCDPSDSEGDRWLERRNNFRWEDPATWYNTDWTDEEVEQEAATDKAYESVAR